jgi:hypothetical protein
MSNTAVRTEGGPPSAPAATWPLWRGLVLSWSGLALLLAAHHRWLLAWIRANGGELGSIKEWMVPPLYATWQGEWPGVRLVPALLAVAAVAAAVPVVLDQRRRSARVVALGMGLFLATGLGVASIDGPHHYRGVVVPAFATPLAHWASDYFGDVPKVERLGPGGFVQRYAQPRFFGGLATHSKTHPPGPVLFHWLVSRIVGYHPVRGAFAVIAVGALAVPLIFLIGRDVYGAEVARRAMLLWLVTPSAILYGVTSMDSVFMVSGLVSLWLFAGWWRGAPGAWRPLLLGVSLAICTFLTYSLFFMGACLISIALLDERRQWRRAFFGGALALVGYLGVYSLLMVVGFNPLRALRASIGYDAGLMGTGVESVGRYFNQTIAQVMAFGFGLGVAVGGIWLRGLGAAVKTAATGAGRDAFALGSGLTLLAMIFSSLFSFEVERVWLFMVPPLVLVAGRQLWTLEARVGGRAMTYATLAVSAVQLLLAETLLGTFW